jgi:GTP cyclohydrolase II
MSLAASPARITVDLPTPFGLFEAHAFERPSGHVYLALVFGEVDGRSGVLTRVHSECLTGDALGSLRCDCGVQLRESLRTIAAAGQGVLIYATGHEGRGIGLMNKLRAYVEQQAGADTVDANHLLGLPADARDYGDAAEVVRALGIHSVRLLTNNPAKATGLRAHRIPIDEVVPLRTVSQRRNADYLATKVARMGHVTPFAELDGNAAVVDPARLIGRIRPTHGRPFVVVKLAQSLDGRIATRSGDSQWISSEPERALSHALRAACDAVIVGAGTVVRDDPRLTVRAVAGSSPMRVVLDSQLRSAASSQMYNDDGSTLVLTTDSSDPEARERLRRAGVGVQVLPAQAGRIDLTAALGHLRQLDMEVVLVEGGATLVTALLRAGVVDRMIVSIAPIVLGVGVDAVGDLGVASVADALTLQNRVVTHVGDDVVVAGDICNAAAQGGRTVADSTSEPIRLTDARRV